jgi:hypothetical protein
MAADLQDLENLDILTRERALRRAALKAAVEFLTDDEIHQISDLLREMRSDDP